MRPAVQQPSFDGQPVLHPEPLNVNERALPLAEDEVLQGRQRYEVVLENTSDTPPEDQTQYSTETPAGRSLSFTFTT